jgi:hypothetical protein
MGAYTESVEELLTLMQSEFDKLDSVDEVELLQFCVEVREMIFRAGITWVAKSDNRKDLSDQEILMRNMAGTRVLRQVLAHQKEDIEKLGPLDPTVLGAQLGKTPQ